MTRHIPANSEERAFPAAAVIAYCYDSARGPALIAYKGRQTKPARFHFYPSIERRDESLAALVKEQTEIQEAKRARRDVGHALLVGDIVYSSWGYEQTNVDFYQVVRVPSDRSAVICKIEQQTIENGSGSMSGTTTPKPSQFVPAAAEAMHRAAGLHLLTGGKTAHGSLYRWDGSPRSVSWYG